MALESEAGTEKRGGGGRGLRPLWLSKPFERRAKGQSAEFKTVSRVVM